MWFLNGSEMLYGKTTLFQNGGWLFLCSIVQNYERPSMETSRFSGKTSVMFLVPVRSLPDAWKKVLSVTICIVYIGS